MIQRAHTIGAYERATIRDGVMQPDENTAVETVRRDDPWNGTGS